jgi:hypothetical protein
MKTITSFLLKLVLIATCILYACSNPKNKNTKTHERLIGCQTKYIMDDGQDTDGYHKNHENFIKDYFSEKQIRDNLIVTTLIEVNACGETIGDIEFSGDTLFLKTRQIADEECTSIAYNSFTYKIHNPSKKKYIILTQR